ncbi:hypothetical protein MMC13_002100 [Lambiella insularis]|nr:hypothetical protein [Lambiella insularis]
MVVIPSHLQVYGLSASLYDLRDDTAAQPTHDLAKSHGQPDDIDIEVKHLGMKRDSEDNTPLCGREGNKFHTITHGERLGPSPLTFQHPTNSSENALTKFSSPQTTDGTIADLFGRPPHLRRIAKGVSLIEVQGPPSSVGRKYNVFERSVPMATRAVSRRHGAVIAKIHDWSNWVELAVQFSGFPSYVTTKGVWTTFKAEGEVLTIELFDDSNGKSTGRGRVRFSPPPTKAFWQRDPYETVIEATGENVKLVLKLLPRKRDFLSSSLVNPTTKYAEVMVLPAESVDFGFMHEPATMMGMYRVVSTASSTVNFRLNLLHREIEVSFEIIFDPRALTRNGLGRHEQDAKHVRIQHYKFVIPLAQAVVIHQVTSGQKSALLMSLETPPNFYRKYPEAGTHTEGATYWSRRQSFFRQTDIMFDPRKLKEAPVALKKVKPTIDIGRWTTYHFVFDMVKTGRGLYTTLCNALKDFNIEILPMPTFKLTTNRDLAVWEYIDHPVVRDRLNPRTALDDLMAEDIPSLSFPVRYQLEVCISEGWLNEHNLTKEFVEKLMSVEAVKAQDLLEYVASRKQRVYNPMKIFDVDISKSSAQRPKIPLYCTYVRSATVTPSTIYFSTPTVETSNRVVRQYAEHADRFLRVRFTDEKFQGRLNATEGETMNEVFTRVKRTLNNGITIGDRHFEYLASGNSQFREHGAYFFSPLAHLGVDDIRRWMGDFQDIKVVAKYAARLGQCFSTTRAINGSRVNIVEIPDIQHGKYEFTDGVGKISKFLAQMAASEVGVTMPSGEPPSVFQFRLGGAKGVLTVCADAKMREIHLRPSQYKFHALHTGLEVIRWSQFSAAHLNRQLITVLSALGVPDLVFVKMLKKQLSSLAQAMTDERMALSLLQKEIDPNQMTLALAGMVLDGFQKVQEPFMLSLLQLWRAWSIKYLKEKAKIVVHQGAVLLGCVDETGTLRGHHEYLQHLRCHVSEKERIQSLPEVFVQLSKGIHGKPQVITGPMLLARNPSLHPGDIRVVHGVDVSKLHHLKDVVVLPQTGDRDIAHMCSGGDLDGDDYFISWDKQLLPREWNHDPMDYTALSPVEVNRDVTTDDITTFFVNYMKNDSLPMIAHAHLATADYLPNGVKDPKCLELAQLHSKAVDYPKTGVAATITSSLRPKLWPHFMEKRYKPKEQIYVSKKVLGQLYDQVERIDFVPEFDAPFDERILQAYHISHDWLQKAAEVKESYDAAMHRIMAQHEIRTEFEVWSTFVLQHAHQSKDFKFHEEMGQISVALKERFRTACYEKAGGRDFGRLGPFVAAMYQITHSEVRKALLECRQVRVVGGKEVKVRQKSDKNMPLMSFPWLFPGILGKIANGELGAPRSSANDLTFPIHGQIKKPSPKRRGRGSLVGAGEDTLQTAEGFVHRGELLKLFDHVDAFQMAETQDTFGGQDVAPLPPLPIDKDSSDGSPNKDLAEMEVAKPWAREILPCLIDSTDTHVIPCESWKDNKKANQPIPAPSDVLLRGPEAATSYALENLIDIDTKQHSDYGMEMLPASVSNYIDRKEVTNAEFWLDRDLDLDLGRLRSHNDAQAINQLSSNPQATHAFPISLDQDGLAKQTVPHEAARSSHSSTVFSSKSQMEPPPRAADTSDKGIAPEVKLSIKDPGVVGDLYRTDLAVESRNGHVHTWSIGGAIRAMEDGDYNAERAMVEEVTLHLHDKPSLLERLAMLNRD